MRFLLDQPISWIVGNALRAAGHEVLHTSELRLATASDSVILERATAEKCVIVTQDTDFGTLLSGAGRRLPSVILFRMRDGRPSVQAKALLENIPVIEQALREGAIVVMADTSIRVRHLPIS
jgi:predicted nuclease of predicted toxin-antitoxin system